MEHDVGLVRT